MIRAEQSSVAYQGAQLVMQPNGNLAVVAPGGQALWSTDTFRQTYADIKNY